MLDLHEPRCLAPLGYKACSCPWRKASFTLCTLRTTRHCTCPPSISCEIGGAGVGYMAGDRTTPPVELERCLRVSGGEVKGSLERVLQACRRESPLFRRGHQFLTSWNQRWAHVQHCAEGVQPQNGYGSVPFLCAFSDSKDAAELLRMISSHDCRAQNLLLVFTSDVRSGGTRRAGDSHSGIRSFPWSCARCTPVVGHLEEEDAAAQPDFKHTKQIQ